MTEEDKPRIARPWLVTTVIVVAVIIALIAVAIPSFIKKRSMTAQEMCIEALRQIDSGKEQWSMAATKETNTLPEKK